MNSRLEIAALLAELSNLGDAGRIDAFSRLFAENGTYKLPNGSVANGPAAIERMLSEFSNRMAGLGNAAPNYMRHNITTSYVEMLGDDTARGDTYFLNVSNIGLDHWGRWRDRFTRDTNRRWLFASREVVVEGMSATSWLKLQT